MSVRPRTSGFDRLSLLDVTLQDAQKGDFPILILIETNAGRGTGKPTSKVTNEKEDIFAFTLYNMGVDFKEKSKRR